MFQPTRVIYGIFRKKCRTLKSSESRIGKGKIGILELETLSKRKKNHDEFGEKHFVNSLKCFSMK